VSRSKSDRSNFYAVGVGVSAGGVQSLKVFLNHWGAQPNAALIIAVHLPLGSQTSLVELPQAQTPLPVVEITAGTTPTANQVYVVPAGQLLDFHAGQFTLGVPLQAQTGTPNSIDSLFHTLAAHWGDRAIAILLSGTGEDGLAGLQAVGRVGGLALVQSAETMQFSSLLTPDQEMSFVDEISSPEALAEVVQGVVAIAPAQNQTDLIKPEQLQEILSILADRENIDLSHYRKGTLHRRIYHRCALSQCDTLDQYIQKLPTSETERQLLRRAILIGATQFFRDPNAWAILEGQVLPEVLAQIDLGGQLRIWVSACATGEEAYSMAIAVQEAIIRCQREDLTQIKIFATDLDVDAIAIAARGVYPTTIQQQLSPSQLERFFTPHPEGFQVKPALRKLVIFAPHDLSRNPGFSQMHLVSCRNVMIYMEPNLQQSVLRRLHFSLLPQGVLFLGHAENLGELAPEFTVVDFKSRIFRKRRNVHLPFGSESHQPPTMPSLRSEPTRSAQAQFNQLLDQVFQVCLGDRQLTCFLVNADNKIMRVFHNSAQLLVFPVGEFELKAQDVVLPDLRLPLTTALYQTRRNRQPVAYGNLSFEHQGQNHTATLRISLSPDRPAWEGYLIVAFEVDAPLPAEQAIAPSELNTQAAEQIAELEYELQQTRETLQTTIHELETTNEEQQATNEELLASNEELQSTNEELQAANEELATLNLDYHCKIEELNQLSNDVQNLLRSSNLGVVFLDRDLNLRKFTPAATEALNIRPTDVNRPLAHFTHNLDCDDLLARLHQVIRTQQPQDQEVTLRTTGDRLLMRLRPYLTDDDRCDGLVMVLVEINDLKAIQTMLERRTAELEALYHTVPIGLAVIDDQFTYIRANDLLAQMSNLPDATYMVGQAVSAVLPDRADEIIGHCQRVLDTHQAHSVETTSPHPSRLDTQGIWFCTYYPVTRLNGQQAVGVMVVDITEVKQVERALAYQCDLREAIFNQSADAIFLVDPETLLIRDCNDRAVALFEAESKANLVNTPGNNLQRVQFTDAELAEIVHQMEQDGVWSREIEYVTLKGKRFWGELVAKPFRLGEDRLNLVRVTDISDRRQAQALLERYNLTLEAEVADRTAALRRSENRLATLTNNVPGAVYRYVVHPDGTDEMLYVSPGSRDIWELAPETVMEDVGRTWAMVHPDDVSEMQASVQAATAAFQPWRWEWRIITPSGQLKWVQAAARPERQDNGDVVWDGLILDVTKWRTTETVFHNLVRNIPGGVFRYVLRTDGTDGVLYMSPGCFQLWEIEADRVQQDASVIWSLIHPEDLSTVQASVAVSAQTLEPWQSQWRITTPSGKQKWLQGAGQPERQPNGDVIWDSVILDVTDRHLAEQALRQSELMLRQVTNAMPGAIYQFQRAASGEECFVFIGEGVRNLYEMTPEEATLDIDRVWNLIVPEDRDRVRQAIDRSAETLENWRIEHRIQTPSHQIKWLLSEAVPHRQANDDIIWYGILLDISDRKQAEAQLVELEQLNQLKDEFLSNVSHELRTPITNIKMAAQMLEISLKIGREKDVVQHYLTILQSETKRESDLINDLLELSRLDSGSHQLDYTEIDLASWISQQVTPFYERTRSQGQVLMLEIPDGLPPVTTDLSCLERVLAELLNNACKYSPPKATIQVTAKLEDFGIALSVCNSGVEIPLQERDRIFEKFYRIPNSDPWKHGGTGLGLAIVKRLVEALKGKLTLHCEKKQTCFIIQLPLNSETEPWRD